jgi:hypothetical protein
VFFEMKVDMEQDDVFGKCIEATGRRAWGMEHGAWGMGHGAWGMVHRACLVLK